MPNVSLEGLSADQVSNLAALAKGMSENPETRGDFLKLLKKQKPELSIPEVDLPVQMESVVKPLQEQIATLQAEKAEAEARQRVLDARNEVVGKGLAKAEDIPEIEKLMLERGITSHATAAEFYASQQRAAVPTPSRFTGGNQSLPQVDLKAAGVGSMKQWARQEAHRVLDDIRAGRIVTG